MWTLSDREAEEILGSAPCLGTAGSMIGAEEKWPSRSGSGGVEGRPGGSSSSAKRAGQRSIYHGCGISTGSFGLPQAGGGGTSGAEEPPAGRTLRIALAKQLREDEISQEGEGLTPGTRPEGVLVGQLSHKRVAIAEEFDPIERPE